jgi:predicted NUDIX family phosphoesterase
MPASIKTIKHPQFILATKASCELYKDIVPEQVYYPLTHFTDGILGQMQSDLVIARRDELEDDLGFRQLLPYQLFTRGEPGTAEFEFFSYKRTKQVGEQRLAGKTSIGVGGHVDLEDVAFHKSIINLFSTIDHATVRERTEEVEFLIEDPVIGVRGFHPNIAPKVVGLLLGSAGVDRFHVGLVTHAPFLPNVQIRIRENELASGRWRRARDLYENRDEYELESWTRTLLEHYVLNDGFN